MKSQFGSGIESKPEAEYYPEVKFGTKGNRYSITFVADQRMCDIFALLVNMLSQLQKLEGSFKIKDVHSTFENQIYSLQIDFEESVGNPKSKIVTQGTIYIYGEMTNEKPSMQIILEKTDQFSNADLEAFMACYVEANRPRTLQHIKNFSSSQQVQAEIKQQQEIKTGKTLQELEKAGVTIFMPDNKERNLDWNYLAGYEKQKRDIEDTVLLALQYPEVYDSLTALTRVKNEPNRPKAILFEGPPGTGKTTTARIIAQQVQIPLVYLPIESFMSKWYGESERQFADIWKGCQQLGRAIIFIDEIDAIAQQRGGEMHEVSRRILSTLLRKIDSFESNTNVLLICATNRKQDLDAAMLSRIDLSVKFDLPDNQARQEIFQRYAKHLTDKERDILSQLSNGMSGRNISDICKDAERRWAAKLIRKEVTEQLPSLAQYKETLTQRLNNFA
ncbi:unnamed protein product (macronuclear) [Paramecium tetraurelia]|uniref:AAA+ ATPase domain-containing protein n=1 Tax=Paramecium tetraurelia TaxID=5888 RepID=A0C7Q6_PARTE|nr:uncharacterized protein GSPATT00035954001 [Paramecium tetraurelia]CAK66823.1 unnamed protein product [Paramecium tetraurelia]|eukprot:XP_001434220.1 hypothetical protein (macronuclear) [Paramecium tetraurelia strain d4-2]